MYYLKQQASFDYRKELNKRCVDVEIAIPAKELEYHRKEETMGYVEITRPDGTKTLLGDVPMLICQMCNEMPHLDDSVRIHSISPLQWQCEKCHAVNG